MVSARHECFSPRGGAPLAIAMATGGWCGAGGLRDRFCRGPLGRPAQLCANARGGAPSAAGRSSQDAEECADRKGAAEREPWLELVPGPAVHAYLAALTTLALAYKDRAARRVEVGLAQRERF